MTIEKYQQETKGYTMTTVMAEAARCLLCHDAPCSAACPAHTDPAKFIAVCAFATSRVLLRPFGKITPWVQFVPGSVPLKNIVN